MKITLRMRPSEDGEADKEVEEVEEVEEEDEEGGKRDNEDEDEDGGIANETDPEAEADPDTDPDTVLDPEIDPETASGVVLEGELDAELPPPFVGLIAVGLADCKPERVGVATINTSKHAIREWSVPSGLRPTESLAFRSWIDR